MWRYGVLHLRGDGAEAQTHALVWVLGIAYMAYDDVANASNKCKYERGCSLNSQTVYLSR